MKYFRIAPAAKPPSPFLVNTVYEVTAANAGCYGCTVCGVPPRVVSWAVSDFLFFSPHHKGDDVRTWEEFGFVVFLLSSSSVVTATTAKHVDSRKSYNKRTRGEMKRAMVDRPRSRVFPLRATYLPVRDS